MTGDLTHIYWADGETGELRQIDVSRVAAPDRLFDALETIVRDWGGEPAGIYMSSTAQTVLAVAVRPPRTYDDALNKPAFIETVAHPLTGRGVPILTCNWLPSATAVVTGPTALPPDPVARARYETLAAHLQAGFRRDEAMRFLLAAESTS